MNNNILLFSPNPNFINEVAHLIGDIGYNLKQIQKSNDIDSLDIQYKPSVALIEAIDDRAVLLKTYDSIYNKYKAAKIVFIYKNNLPFDPDQLGGRKKI
jgi:hypothetical protein